MDGFALVGFNNQTNKEHKTQRKKLVAKPTRTNFKKHVSAFIDAINPFILLSANLSFMGVHHY